MDDKTNTLNGQVAIVTGGAQGMGAAIAGALGRHGANVVVSDINLLGARTIADDIANLRTGAQTLAISTDVSNENQVHDMIDQVIERFGKISILVNNAGILLPTRIEDMSTEEWNAVIDVNLTGTFLCSKASLPNMKKNSFGRIVNMSSSAGKNVSTLGGAHYTASKAGVLGLTRALAKEVAQDGILVNAVCPGLIDTGMVRRNCSAKLIGDYEKSFPIGRLGQVDEVADLVVFLCTGGSYITGASIDINGGDLMV